MFWYIYEILFAGYLRGFTMFKLLCLELVILSICNMFRRSINRRWPDMGWIVEAIGTFETGLIIYTEMVMFSIVDLRYYVIVLFVNAMFTFLVNDCTIQTRKYEYLKDDAHLSELYKMLNCMKRRLISFFNRLAITIASMFFMKPIILLALSSEFECDDLSCMVTCERSVSLFSSNFWFVALSETVLIFLLEWAYLQANVLDGVSRDSAKSVVKIFFVSMCFYLGFPVKIIYLNPFTAYLFLNVCEIEDLLNHLVLHSLFPLLGILAVCFFCYIINEPSKTRFRDENRRMPDDSIEKYVMEDACGDHNHNSNTHANNNSKQNHHDPNWNRRRFKMEDNYSQGSESSYSDDGNYDDLDDNDGGNVNNCTKSEFYDDDDDEARGSSNSDNSYSPYHAFKKTVNHRPDCPKLTRRFSDTSLTENRRKQKRKDNKYCCQHGTDVDGHRCAHHCHKIKDNIIDDRSNSYQRKNFTFKNVHAFNGDSDDSRDSIYEDIVMPHSSRKHVHEKGMHRTSHVTPLKEFDNNVYYDHHRHRHQHHHEKSHRHPLKEFLKNSLIKHDRCHDKENKDGRSCKSGQKMWKSDYENAFREDHKMALPRKRLEFESKESAHGHRASCKKNNFHVCENKRFSRWSDRNFERDNLEDFDKDEPLNRQASSRDNLKPHHKHRHFNECRGNVDDFNAYTKHYPKLYPQMSNNSFDGRDDRTKHGRYHKGDARHPTSYHDVNKFNAKRISIAAEETCYDDFDNCRKSHHGRQRLYANKTQNAKDPIRHKRRSSTPIASSATYTVDHSPTGQDVDDKNSSIASNRRSSKTKFIDENDHLIKQRKSIDKSKEGQNGPSRKLLMATENMSTWDDRCAKVKRDAGGRETLGRHKDAKSDDSSSRNETLRMDGDHSHNCRRRCSHLYDIFESDES